MRLSSRSGPRLRKAKDWATAGRHPGPVGGHARGDEGYAPWGGMACRRLRGRPSEAKRPSAWALNSRQGAAAERPRLVRENGARPRRGPSEAAQCLGSHFAPRGPGPQWGPFSAWSPLPRRSVLDVCHWQTAPSRQARLAAERRACANR